MVICGSYMFEFSVSKDMKFMIHRKGGDNREGRGLFMSNTNCQGIENNCWVRHGANNIKYNQTLNIIFSVLANPSPTFQISSKF
jgi:hypothetical protein